MAVDAPPAFEPIDAAPMQEPIDVRKGRRTLSQSPAAVAARRRRAAKREGKGADVKRRKSPARRGGPKSLAPEIGALLTLINGAIIVSPLGTRPIEAIADPAVPPTRLGDELDAAEIAALASGIDAQCRRSPRFRKYVEMVLGAGSGGTLMTVVALIAARRAARHGMLPAEVDAMAGMVLAADVGALADLGDVQGEQGGQDDDTGETIPDRSESADE